MHAEDQESWWPIACRLQRRCGVNGGVRAPGVSVTATPSPYPRTQQPVECEYTSRLVLTVIYKVCLLVR